MSMDKIKTKILDRRQILKGVGLGALALAGTGLSSKTVQATPDKASEYLSKLTSGAAGTKGKVTVKLPEIAENGRKVALEKYNNDKGIESLVELMKLLLNKKWKYLVEFLIINQFILY